MNCNKPIVLVFFNRPEMFRQVLEKVREVKPPKVYLICDAPRLEKNEEEKVNKCKEIAEELIDWECEVIKNYASTNMGCYDRIAGSGGASWVFKYEDEAIFLEDDNVPDISFFRFCEEMLDKYRENEKIFWICGGNYLLDYKNTDNSSYIFSRQMFPCGWASWKRAWKYYDGTLESWDNDSVRKLVLDKIENEKIRRYKEFVWNKLRNQAKENSRLYTWDHQWQFSIIKNDAYGIVPCKNLIHNIGVGADSTHGGVKLTRKLKKIVMLPMYSLDFPLTHPKRISIDTNFEREIEKIVGGTSILIYFLSSIKRKILKAKK